jgi:hypothetical protein
MENSPERQATQLLQCLTQDKKPLGLLLGAGCPYSIKGAMDKPLIPDIRGLTEIVREMVCRKDYGEPWGNICSQLQEDGKNEPNIEDILSRVRGLRDYAGAGDVRGLSKTILEKLEQRICDEIVKCVSKELPHRSTPYHHVTAWIGAIDRSEPVQIFTTNYDLLIEQALEELRIPFFDGFVGSRQPFFDPHAIEFDTLPPRWARLWKIHGSINWRSEIVDGILRVWRTDIKEGGSVVIHPSHLKYEQSRKMPYIAMMDRLRRFLSTPSSALIIVGYSFRDQHLNDVIIQGLQGTPSAVAFALMCDPLSNCSTAISLAKERVNLCLIAKDGAVIRTKETLWGEAEELPDLNLPGGAVEWTKGPGQNDSWKANFNLGDFRSFGSFLQDISGIKDTGK